MTIQSQPLADVTRRAIEILSRELGPADTLRFMNQFTTGSGDYTAERDELFGEVTIEQIVAEVKSQREGGSKAD